MCELNLERVAARTTKLHFSGPAQTLPYGFLTQHGHSRSSRDVLAERINYILIEDLAVAGDASVHGRRGLRGGVNGGDRRSSSSDHS
jgi:hypothetical protein